MKLGWCLLCLGMWAGCQATPSSKARKQYNSGLEKLSNNQLETASSDFVEARGNAGGDGELRFRSAMALGKTEGLRAESLEAEDANGALKALETSASWYSDAVRLREDNKEAREALQTVRWRAQVLADKINKGENGLEPRIIKTIEAQRANQGQIRQLLSTFDPSNTNAVSGALETIATSQRGLYSDTGTIMDLAADELALIESAPEEEWTDEQKLRRYQLQALDGYLGQARGFEDDCRRNLRRDKPNDAHNAATTALASLSRAHEQLMDPSKVLQRIAADQEQVLKLGAGYSALQSNVLSLDKNDKEAQNEATQGPPSWLKPEFLVERQDDAKDRLAELAGRFEAFSEAPEPKSQDDASQNPEAQAQMQELVDISQKAKPHLNDALDYMNQATEKLSVKNVKNALPIQNDALRELMYALELFAPLRQVIELAYADQQSINETLEPKSDNGMSGVERKKQMADSSTRNIERLKRLVGLLEKEKNQQIAQMSQKANPEGGEAPDTSGIDAMFDKAEGHRQKAEEATAEFLQSLKQNGSSLGKEKASIATLELEELRRIFFSIVEHLKELLRAQTLTRDDTAKAEPLLDDERAQLLSPAADSQGEHASMAGQLAEALASQADAASAAEDPNAAGQAEAIASAQAEVSSAQSTMQSALGPLQEAKEEVVSVDLEPVLEDQAAAIEHLEEAIRLLEPPQNKQQEEDQDQQNQEQKEQQKQEEQKQANQGNAKRRMQNIRDREAERQKERGQPRQEPVEKDW